MKLFCIPYAGGSSMYYSKWSDYLHTNIEIIPLELSGRGERFGEELYGDFQAAVDDLYNAVLHNRNVGEPYALFGHSMGALLAYELYLKLAQNEQVLPIHIFFSGREAPHINLHTTKRGGITHLPDNEFLKEIKKYNGMTEEFLNNSELIDLFLPIIRADFFIIENYRYRPNHNKMNCPITILNGYQDNTTEANMNEWANYTNEPCDVVNFDGSHFFIDGNLVKVLDVIQSHLNNKKLNKNQWCEV